MTDKQLGYLRGIAVGVACSVLVAFAMSSRDGGNSDYCGCCGSKPFECFCAKYGCPGTKPAVVGEDGWVHPSHGKYKFKEVQFK